MQVKIDTERYKKPINYGKMSEMVFLGLAQGKKHAIIEAFLPSNGRESWNRIYIKTCVKLRNDGRNGIAEDDTHYCIWKQWCSMPIGGDGLTAGLRPVFIKKMSHLYLTSYFS